jgi:uncharacterized membrane-anchored protein YhcB (DUF1043 family)
MKTKPVLLVLITLIIGFVLGMLTSAQIRLNKLKPVRLYFSEERFREGLYKTIEPDEKQKNEIEKILEKYAKINSDLQEDFRKSYDVSMKEFRKEIDSKLTKEQLDRIKEMEDKRQEMIREFRKNHRNDTTGRRDQGRDFSRGPGPGGRPSPGDRGFQGERPPYPGPDSLRSTDNK